jgi:hypothetical protein
MYEKILIDSRFPKNDSKYASMDIVLFNKRFFVGFDIYKNMENYLTKNWQLPVFITNNYKRAKAHFEDIIF